MNKLRALTGVFCLLACTRDAPPIPPPQQDAPAVAAPPAVGTAPRREPEPADAAAWRTAYDWDGDGKTDEVVSELSGGAHCCYRVGVRLTSTRGVVMLPFNLDGGYVGGEDLPSKPERFAIRAAPGAPPEMFLEIETYNGSPGRLNPKWKKAYGVSTHHVAVQFTGGRVRARDVR